eukprot:3928725-Rhodomonas_salina.2
MAALSPCMAALSAYKRLGLKHVTSRPQRLAGPGRLRLRVSGFGKWGSEFWGVTAGLEIEA